MSSLDKVPGSQIPMNVTTDQEQTPKSCYGRIKQYIPCGNMAPTEPKAPRTYFSLAKQYLPTSIYVVAGIGTCVNAYNGDILSAIGYAGGGFVLMVVRDRCLGGPPAPTITPQQIVDLESRQEANAHMLETDTKAAADIDKLEKKETQDLQTDISALEHTNEALTRVIDVEKENEKEEDQLIDDLQSTLNKNAEFLKNLNNKV